MHKFGPRTWSYLFNLLHNPDNSGAVLGAITAVYSGWDSLSHSMLSHQLTKYAVRLINALIRLPGSPETC